MHIAILYNQDSDLLDDDPGQKARADVAQMAASLASALESESHEVSQVPLGRRPFDDLDALLRDPPDAAFNLCESIWGDARGEAVVPVLLDLAGVPYTGSGSLSLMLALHKPKAKEVLRARGVPTPDWVVLDHPRQARSVRLPFPLIVKPSREDASSGIHAGSVVHHAAELERAAERVIDAFRQPALVEQYISGRELCVALMGNPPRPLPLSEIDFSQLPAHLPPIVTYAGKWDEGSVECVATPSVPSALDGPAAKRAVDVACAAFEALECRDYGRVDLRLDPAGTPYVIDINPNCDLSPGAGFARAALRAGLDYGALAVALVETARRRHATASFASPRPPRARADAATDRALHGG